MSNEEVKNEQDILECFKADERKSEREDKTEERHPMRTNFQRDRDRILYSRAFRRLSGKTQVFRTGNDDHIRTRLTHTLEVSQIARTIVKELRLDEELTEAIALGHDLGHTPFGHVGERALNNVMNGCYKIADFNLEIGNLNRGFKHNLQGARVVNELEDKSLNLTKQTIWGIVNHSKLKYKPCQKDDILNCDAKHMNNGESPCNKSHSLDFYDYVKNGVADDKHWTLEALVVGMADEIAQRHHDIEDAIEFNIISADSLYENIKNCFEMILEQEGYKEHKHLLDKLSEIDEKYIMVSNFSRFIVNFLTTDLINNSKKQIEEIAKNFEINSKEDFEKKKMDIIKENKDNIIGFSEGVKNGDEELEKFLKNRILKSFEAQRMDGMGNYVITKLFEAYLYNPQQLRDKSIKTLYRNILKRIDSMGMEVLKEKYADKNKVEDIGEIRQFISELHYDKGLDESMEKIYTDALLRTVCDYISGMTDNYAIKEHKALYNQE